MMTLSETTDKIAFSAQDDQPLVSVLIPLYNHETYVADCINSIAAQSYPNIEIVLVDDASADSGLTVARDKLSGCGLPYTVLENVANRGVCATLNRAVAAARGHYACIIASDDLLARNRIARHIGILQTSGNPRIAACHGPLQVMDVDSAYLGRKGVLSSGDRYTLASVVTKTGCPTLQGCTLKTFVLRDLPFDESLFFEDWDFFIRLFLDKYEVIPDTEISLLYRQHCGGANRQIRKMIAGREAIGRKHGACIADRDPDLARAFEFAIAYANLMGLSYTGETRAWTAALGRLLARNPKAALQKSRSIVWSLRNLLSNRSVSPTR